MSERIDAARDAFEQIYVKDLWGLAEQPSAQQYWQIFATLIEQVMRTHKITSVSEFGCGFWSYARLMDWRGISYNGYDVFAGAIDWNEKSHGAANIAFHTMAPDTALAPADLLITKDVLQHLPNADVAYYLKTFRPLFSFMLIVNDIYPDTHTNGDIAHGGHRALRLEQAPFNETCDIVAEWDSPAFGVNYRKRAYLLRGTRPLGGLKPAP